MPNTIAVEAPSAAPAETPTTPGSASGLPKTACMRAPATASAAPTASAITIRGKRTTSNVATMTGSAGAQEVEIPSQVRRVPTTSVTLIGSCPTTAETMTAAIRIATSALDRMTLRTRTRRRLDSGWLTGLDGTIPVWQISPPQACSRAPSPRP